MSCPPIPLRVNRWNLWRVATSSELDAEDVRSWLADMIGQVHGTEVHDVSVTEVPENATPPNVATILWRRGECDPLPFLDANETSSWFVQFVARGDQQSAPIPEGSTDEFLPRFAWLTKDSKRNVPDPPKGVIEKVGDAISKQARRAAQAQFLGALFLGYLAYRVYVAPQRRSRT